MRFEKGHKRSKGRPKGSKNKNTLAYDVVEKDMGVDKFIKSLMKAYNEIEEPKDKIGYGVKILEYLVPKLKAVDQSLSVTEEGGQVTIVYKIDDGKDKQGK